MGDLAISNIRELDMNEIQDVSGGYVSPTAFFGAGSAALQLGSLAAGNAGYNSLSNSLGWGSATFAGFAAYFGW